MKKLTVSPNEDTTLPNPPNTLPEANLKHLVDKIKSHLKNSYYENDCCHLNRSEAKIVLEILSPKDWQSDAEEKEQSPIQSTLWEDVEQVLKAHNIYTDKDGLVYDVCQITRRRIEVIEKQLKEIKR